MADDDDKDPALKIMTGGEWMRLAHLAMGAAVIAKQSGDEDERVKLGTLAGKCLARFKAAHAAADKWVGIP